MAKTTKVSDSDLALTPARKKSGLAELLRFAKFFSLIPLLDHPGKFQSLEWFQKIILLLHFAGVKHVMVLMPKGNGKTTLLAALAIYHMLTTDRPRVYIGASNVKQAKTMYNECIRVMECRKAWQRKLVKRTGYRAIHYRSGEADGSLEVLASDKLEKGSLEGLIPTLGIVEELHAHINDSLYAAINGGLPKRNGRMVSISTAGKDVESLLGKIRARARKFSHQIVKDCLRIARSDRGEFAMLEWSLENLLKPGQDYEELDTENMALVKRANPAGFVTKAGLQDIFDDPGTFTGRWLRYHCGIWATGDGTWADGGEYDSCYSEGEVLLPGDSIVLGYDHARRYDHASLVALRPDPPEIGEDKKPVEGSGSGFTKPLNFWDPEDEDGGKVPYWKIKEGIRDACAMYDVIGVGYDKLGGFAQSAEELEDEGVPMIEVSMRSATWAPLTAEMGAAMKSRRWRHDGDKTMRKHVMAGETKDTPDGERLHGRVPGKVDGLISTGIAWFVAFGTDLLSTRGSIWDRRAESEEALL